VPFVTKVKIGK